MFCPHPDIPKLEVTRILTDWIVLEKIIRSNHGKENFVYFRRNEANTEIFETLAKLGDLSRTDTRLFMQQGVICLREKHMLLGIKLQEKSKNLKYKLLKVYVDE